MPREILLPALLSLLLSAPVSAERPARQMAVTIDDLPYVSLGQPEELGRARRATAAILAALAAQRAPAVGFVNEAKLQVKGEVDERIALLERWVAAGHELGNHTFSHPDFNTLTTEQFADEIVKGEVVTRRLMAGRTADGLYFRHPMTHTGETVEKKEAIERFLAARGYRVAPHTIENSDYLFNAAYVVARRAGDEATAAKVRAAYLDFTVAVTAFAEEISPKVFGREPAQTLLLHANDLNADALDELLARLAGRGYWFVSLDEAMREPAYATPDRYVGRHGPSWLFRWSRSLGQTVSFAAEPEPPGWITELAARR